ncbi:hypothetical protein C8250_003120 [Streptomyces sp. So13.3]|uniref:hypothetical protein n=1 Tax=Streptomyces TaxID=1883 RepID=UPI00164DE7E6|nr:MULTISPECIES: hypothetical protein [Streptomyces]MCZ4095318.1 hypothetical protein [Streptomyces sp. H39-C1]QNA70550.1 hypothetical protein C8250_003120 [Streptomyces sp. So13.3]
MNDERFSRLAAEHLPDDLAERRTALLRPCIRLRRAARGEQAVTRRSRPTRTASPSSRRQSFTDSPSRVPMSWER